MERRELWAWLGGGAVALGTLGLGVAGLMANAQPLAYWSTVAVLVACFVFGGVVLYLLNRHRFFGAEAGRGLRVRWEGTLAPDKTGMPGWHALLQITEPLRVLRVVGDGPIYSADGSCLDYDREVKVGPLGSPRPNVRLLYFPVAGGVDPGRHVLVSVQSPEPVRVVKVESRALPPALEQALTREGRRLKS